MPRTFKTLILALLSAAVLATALPAAAQYGLDLSLKVKPVPLDSSKPDRQRLGDLVYLGGLELRSDDPDFGGLSGLSVAPSGDKLLAITDGGNWVTAEILKRDERLYALRRGKIGQMIGANGVPLSKLQSDAEALWVDARGRVWLSFERDHRIVRHLLSGPWALDSVFYTLPDAFDDQDQLRGLPNNGGIETLVGVGTKGQLLAISEQAPASRNGLVGWLINGREMSRLSYHTDRGFRPTDATRLPNGDILVLERRYNRLTGVACRIRRIQETDVVPGAQLSGPIIANFFSPVTVDNFEAISTFTTPEGETHILIASDNNFSAAQRTLLMMFRYDPVSDTKKAPAPEKPAP